MCMTRLQYVLQIEEYQLCLYQTTITASHYASFPSGASVFHSMHHHARE